MSKALLPELYAKAMVLFSYLDYYLAILLDGTSGHKALVCYVCVCGANLPFNACKCYKAGFSID